MAVRQYIGARYTIKIYENSLDPSSAAWEGGFPYEYLTLVTVNNDAYLSKKDVPSSVGSPALNPTYWVKVGDFNGQIANLQNQINAILNDIDFISTKHIVMLTDSYGTRTNANGDTVGDILSARGVDLKYYEAVSGGGFSTYTYQLKNYLNNYTGDHNEITDVYYCCSANDNTGTLSDLRNAIEDNINAAKASYPNARIVLVPWGVGFKNTAWCNFLLNTTPKEYKNMADICGAICAENAQYMLRNTQLLESDLEHPNAAGVSYLANRLYGYINGSPIDVDYSISVALTPVAASNITNYSGQNITMRRHNNVVTLTTVGAGGLFGDFEHDSVTGYLSINPAFTIANSLINSPEADTENYISCSGKEYTTDAGWGHGYLPSQLKFKIFEGNIRFFIMNVEGYATNRHVSQQSYVLVVE